MDQEKQLEITQETHETQETQEAQKAPATLYKSPFPPLPKWPTSKRGPLVTEPPPGTKRMPLRTEQVVEIAYDQERGKRIDNS